MVTNQRVLKRCSADYGDANSVDEIPEEALDGFDRFGDGGGHVGGDREHVVRPNAPESRSGGHVKPAVSAWESPPVQKAGGGK